MRGSSHGDVVVSFHGVRGSTPCHCPTQRRYGGNTSCVTIEATGQDPIILDLGTGLRMFAAGAEGAMTAHALLTHLHWDHVQGLPFFTPLHRSQTEMTVYGPGEGDESLAQCMARFMAPPFFPVTADELPGRIDFVDVLDGDFTIGDTRVSARPVPHTGPTAGYRVTRNGVSVAYLPDHQEPLDGSGDVSPGVLELCRDVDLLIHDAQYTSDEFAVKGTWGHSTPEYAVEVARRAGAAVLVLFHHDPGHDDDTIDAICDRTRRLAADDPFTVLAASEGLKLTLPTRTGDQ